MEGDMQEPYFIFLAICEPWVEYCSQEFFGAIVSAEIEVKFCENCIRSSCIRLQWNVGAVIRDVTRGTHYRCIVCMTVVLKINPLLPEMSMYDWYANLLPAVSHSCFCEEIGAKQGTLKLSCACLPFFLLFIGNRDLWLVGIYQSYMSIHGHLWQERFYALLAVGLLLYVDSATPCRLSPASIMEYSLPP